MILVHILKSEILLHKLLIWVYLNILNIPKRLTIPKNLSILKTNFVSADGQETKISAVRFVYFFQLLKTSFQF